MKKILVFSTAYYPFVGGAEVAVKEITERIGKDFEFDLITAKLERNLPAIERIGKVNVYRLGVGKLIIDKLTLPFRGAILAWKLNNKLGNENYFCLWGIMATFGSGAGYVFNIARRLTGKRKIPMVLTLQEGDSESHLKYKWGGLIALSWKLALRQTNVLTAISNFLLQRAYKNGYKGKSFLVPNGVDTRAFLKEISEKQKNELRILLDKKSNDVFLVTTGRLTHKNAVDDIIKALTGLGPDVSLIVIGKGEEGPRLQQEARRLGVADRVKFIGFVHYEDIPKYLSVCDIFVRPSRSEGFGNSFIEAMASGIPVIATPVGGIPDFISDQETGVFCSPDNPASIVNAVKIIMSDLGLKEKITKNAKNLAIDKYSWDKVAVDMKAVFNSLS